MIIFSFEKNIFDIFKGFIGKNDKKNNTSLLIKFNIFTNSIYIYMYKISKSAKKVLKRKWAGLELIIIKLQHVVDI